MNTNHTRNSANTQEKLGEILKEYGKFLQPHFDASVFMRCSDNFAQYKNITSQKIYEMDKACENPTFTIAIPVYKRVETLRETIDSALAQDIYLDSASSAEEKCYEVIVVENVDLADEPTPTQEMLESEYKGKITYYKNTGNVGLLGNFNRCIELAKGKWVCVLHSDDMILPNYLSAMAEILRDGEQNTKDVAMISCLEDRFGARSVGGGWNSLFLEHFQNKTLKSKLYNWTFQNTSKLDFCKSQHIFVSIPPSAVLHNRLKMFELGGYSQEEYPIADNFLTSRIIHNGGKIAVTPQILMKRRIEINDGFNQDTILKYCFIGTSFFWHYSPRFLASHNAYHYLHEYHLTLDEEYKTFIATYILPRFKPLPRYVAGPLNRFYRKKFVIEMIVKRLFGLEK